VLLIVVKPTSRCRTIKITQILERRARQYYFHVQAVGESARVMRSSFKHVWKSKSTEEEKR